MRLLGSRQRAAEGGEHRPVGGLQLGSWDLAAEHAELMTQDEKFQVLGGIAAGCKHEQLDRAAQRQVGPFRQHQIASVMRGIAVTVPNPGLLRTRSSEAAFEFPHPTGRGNLMEQCSTSARHPTSRLPPRLAGGGTVLTKGLTCAHSFRLVLTRRLAAQQASRIHGPLHGH
jgi:hypothetical protein